MSSSVASPPIATRAVSCSVSGERAVAPGRSSSDVVGVYVVVKLPIEDVSSDAAKLMLPPWREIGERQQMRRQARRVSDSIDVVAVEPDG
jgi:hypothetical protein